MPASPQSSLIEPAVTKLAILAGGGVLPARLAEACESRGIEVFIVGFDGHTNDSLYDNRAFMKTRIGAAGSIIHTLRERGIVDLVLIGSIRRPGLAELRPDLRTARFFARVGLRALGDDGLLRALKEELQREGFTIHAVQDFIYDLVAGAGSVGACRPGKAAMADIIRGFDVLHFLAPADVGQSVIVQDGIVLGVEAAEGTDELIRRCAAYRRKGSGGILVKAAKAGQDTDLDMPAIGPATVRLCAELGYDGIAFEAGRTLLVDRAEIAVLADNHKIFVTGHEE